MSTILQKKLDTPSLTSWAELCELIDPLQTLPDGSLEHVQAQLARWPSDIQRHADADLFDWLEGGRERWSLRAINSARIGTAVHLQRLGSAPFASAITSLTLDLNDPTPARRLVAMLHALPALSSLTVLHIGQASADPLLRALARCWPPQLSRLKLARHLRCSPAGLRAFTRHETPLPLTALDIRLTPHTAQLLCQLIAFSGLRELSIRSYQWQTPITELLAASPMMRGLTTLRFTEDMERSAALTIAQSPHLTQLTKLSIQCQSSDVLPALLAAPTLQRLTDLDTGLDCLSDEIAAAITRIPWPRGLQLHDLEYVEISAATAQLLAAHPGLSSLEKLGVGTVDAALLASPHLTALTWLRTSSAAAIAHACANPALRALHTLDMSEDALDLDALTRLSRTSTLTALRKLDLHSASLTTAHLQALAAGPLLQQLDTLDLRDNDLDDACIAALAAALPPSLTTLELSGNKITHIGLSALLQRPALQHIARISLHHNPLGPQGASLLAAHPLLGKIHGRHGAGFHTDGLFGGMAMGDDGLLALLDSPLLLPLSSLDLTHNDLSPIGLDRLARHPILRGLRCLSIDGDSDALQALLTSPGAAALQGVDLFTGRGGLLYYPSRLWRAVADAPHLTPSLRAEARHQLSRSLGYEARQRPAG